MDTSLPIQVKIGDQILQVRSGVNNDWWAKHQSGMWEPETQLTFRRFNDKSHSYIDLGAWAGPTVLLGCQLAKRAYVIEADPIAFAELAENISLNKPITDNVDLFEVCLAPVSGPVAFGNLGEGGDTESSMLNAGGKTSWIVNGITFDEFVTQNSIDDCAFIKMDIEGGEYSVLPTMRRYLTAVKPTLYLSIHPFVLGNKHTRGITEWLSRTRLRIVTTIGLLDELRTYKYWCEPLGRCPETTMPTISSRLHHLLASFGWRPIVYLVTLLYAVIGYPSALVVSDKAW